MDLTLEDRRSIENVASETLDLFERIAEVAKNKLRNTVEVGLRTFATPNTPGSAVQNLRQIIEANRADYNVLKNEPAIARVVVADPTGAQWTYYICRAYHDPAFPNLVSYRATLGRLASLPVGYEFNFKVKGTVVEIRERAKLRPVEREDGWDSRNTVVESDSLGVITIESLRALLREITGAELTEDLLEQILAEEKLKDNIIEGVRRSVIEKMGLRDQPILDQYQDEIFRLPLDKRLLILGPPGTGKTTTLIRRLGQKLDIDYLEEDERHVVESVGAVTGADHASSWLMFTPTELLKQYLKEAFAREDVPASDLRIRTWRDYQRDLARDTIVVLRKSSGGGPFVLKDSIRSLKDEAEDRPIEWFSDFDEWQRATFAQELREAAQSLGEGQAVEARGLGQRLASILERSAENSLKLQLNRNKGFLDELALFIDGLPQDQAAEVEEQDGLEAEEEDVSMPRTDRAAAINAYR